MKLDATRVRGRIKTSLGDDTLACEWCKAHKRQYPRAGTLVIWLLGRPLIRICQKCRKDVEATYEGALS